MKVYQNVEELIGKTPLLSLEKLQKTLDLKANVFAKLECFNPAGSVKDRVALSMIKGAEEKGLLKSGGMVIEPTSGNTGIGIASICASRGYKAVLVMPDTMSIERIKLLKAYGAQVVLTSGEKGMQGAIDKANEICKTTPNSIIAGQFSNPLNPLAHYQTTACEILQDLDNKVDIFVSAIGSAGTITGTARRLKEVNPTIKVVGVEPESSPLITKGKSGKHKIQGIGANFIPENLDLTLIDEVLTVSDFDAYEQARNFAKTQGLLIGISSGCALKIALDLAKKEENKGKNIVVIMPDSGDRYLSTDLYD